MFPWFSCDFVRNLKRNLRFENVAAFWQLHFWGTPKLRAVFPLREGKSGTGDKMQNSTLGTGLTPKIGQGTDQDYSKNAIFVGGLGVILFTGRNPCDKLIVTSSLDHQMGSSVSESETVRPKAVAPSETHHCLARSGHLVS